MNLNEIDSLLNIALSQYLGKKCDLCNKLYNNINEIIISDPIYIGKDNNQNMKLACKSCYDRLPTTNQIKKE